MFQNKTFLAIIPARAGSKRIPNKNIVNLNGKPLIAWSIESTLKSKYIDNLIVSTNCEKVIKIASKYNINIPFKRPDSISTDYSTKEDVILHTLNFFKGKKDYDYIVYLQPTSPFRREDNIDNAIEYLFAKKAKAIVSMCENEHPKEWITTLPKDFNLNNFIKKFNSHKRSQDFKKEYRLNGAIFICDTTSFISQKSMFLEKDTYAFIMESGVSIDIDTPLDLSIAEIISKNLNFT